MNDQRVPPNDLDAEAVVLSAVMTDEKAFDEIQHMLRAEHFYADAHKQIFEAATELAREGKPNDLPSVASWLRDRQRLPSVGGSPYLAQIVGAPYVVNLKAQAKRIVDLWRLRSLIAEAIRIASEAYAVPEDIGAFVQAAEGRMYQAAGQEARELRSQTSREVMSGCIEEIKRRRADEAPAGHLTGFRVLDRRIGGLRRGRVYVIAARPGMGKTSLLTQMMSTVATSKKGDRGIFLASLEMPNDQMGDRLLAQDAKLDTRKVELGWLKADELSKLADAKQRIDAWPVVMDDQAGMTVSMIRSSARRARRRLQSDYGVDLGLVGIDYFQLISTADLRWGGSTNDQLEQISKAIADMAKEFDVPVVLLSQLNRECEKRPGKRPQLSDLRGSGALEQDAHTIMFLFREDLYRDRAQHDCAAEIIVAKARGGRCGTVRLSYVDWCVTFGDTQDDDADDELAHYEREANDLGDSLVDPHPNAWGGDFDEQERRYP